LLVGCNYLNNIISIKKNHFSKYKNLDFVVCLSGNCICQALGNIFIHSNTDLFWWKLP